MPTFETTTGRNIVEKLLDLAREHGFPFFEATGTMLKGWLLSEFGHSDEGVVLLRDGIAKYMECGHKVGLGFFFSLLADAQGKNGAAADALTTLREAIISTAAEGVWRPHLLCVRGELFTMLAEQGSDEFVRETSNSRAEAEMSFRKAIKYASAIGAKSMQLRAVTQLGRLLHATGRSLGAKDILEPLYSSFTEGFDTRDLKDAKQLLEACRHQSDVW